MTTEKVIKPIHLENKNEQVGVKQFQRACTDHNKPLVQKYVYSNGGLCFQENIKKLQFTTKYMSKIHGPLLKLS